MDCPVCGYKKLTKPPLNFSICPCCGTEFGYDDAKLFHAELRRQWALAGARWFSRAVNPTPEWNPWLQLINAGFYDALPFRGLFYIPPQSWESQKLPSNERELVFQ